MSKRLLNAIEKSDFEKASSIAKQEVTVENAQEIHDKLYPVVWQVLNPPFINPHLPKMCGICRELSKYLKPANLPALVLLEINEYAKRPKLNPVPKKPLVENVKFRDIEDAIAKNDLERTTLLLSSYQKVKGANELARNVLALGGGYIQYELGHSISCTTFMLLEMLNRSDQDPWPALTTIADYFCKGGFSETQTSNTSQIGLTTVEEYLMRAASGSGIVSLHHSITYYAIEKARNMVSASEYKNMIENWIKFVGEKTMRPFRAESTEIGGFNSYEEFFEAFSRKEVGEMTLQLSFYLDTEQKRLQMGEFLVRGVCDLYDGDYNPHYLTGLGSVLWLISRYHSNRILAMTALHQYLDYFFA